MRKRLLYFCFFLLFALFLGAWIWVGVVKDPEFAAYDLKLKKHATFKLFFYSPLGMSDKTIEDLPHDLQAIEHDYRHFVLGTE